MAEEKKMTGQQMVQSLVDEQINVLYANRGLHKDCSTRVARKFLELHQSIEGHPHSWYSVKILINRMDLKALITKSSSIPDYLKKQLSTNWDKFSETEKQKLKKALLAKQESYEEALFKIKEAEKEYIRKIVRYAEECDRNNNFPTI